MDECGIVIVKRKERAELGVGEGRSHMLGKLELETNYSN
jgi:hypothetical protein